MGVRLLRGQPPASQGNKVMDTVLREGRVRHRKAGSLPKNATKTIKDMPNTTVAMVAIVPIFVSVVPGTMAST